MKTQITIRCPSCLGLSIKKNEWKIYGKQNYRCKDCHRQFIHETDLSYQGCKSDKDYELIKRSLRQIISNKSAIPIDIYLPGIDSIEDNNQWSKNYEIFLHRLWRYLFDCNFVWQPTSNYRERIDAEFINFPHVPEMWKEAQYAENC